MIAPRRLQLTVTVNVFPGDTPKAVTDRVARWMVNLLPDLDSKVQCDSLHENGTEISMDDLLDDAPVDGFSLLDDSDIPGMDLLD